MTHPEVLPPQRKELHFFSKEGCRQGPGGSFGCEPSWVRHYLLNLLQRDAALKAGLQRAAFEATPIYSRVGMRSAPCQWRLLFPGGVVGYSPGILQWGLLPVKNAAGGAEEWRSACLSGSAAS